MSIWNVDHYPTMHIGCTINSLTHECVDHDSGVPIPKAIEGSAQVA